MKVIENIDDIRKLRGKKIKTSISEVDLVLKKSPRWLRLKEQFIVGDEIYYFGSPKKFWERRRGKAGVEITRKGELVDRLILYMN